MATITNAKLAITTNAAAKTAKCIVTCKVFFTTFERNQMKDGLKFSMNCSLWGEDLGNWLNPDDFLYSYGTKYFPDATPTSPESVSFEAVIGTSLLDEDFGTDEVYGLLTLKNLYTGVTVKKKSNVISRSF